MSLTILITALVTVLLTIFVLNLCASEKLIRYALTHDFTVADPQFLLSMETLVSDCRRGVKIEIIVPGPHTDEQIGMGL